MHADLKGGTWVFRRQAGGTAVVGWGGGESPKKVDGNFETWFQAHTWA